MNVQEMTSKANELRRELLLVSNHAKNGHIGGSLSEIDILTSLYFSVMDIDPAFQDKPDRDRFILSKGHASIGYYTTLSARGYFGKEVLYTFDQIGSRLQAHPDMHKCPGVDFSAGSLGQGLSVGVGIALGAKLRGETFVTFVLIGDGESQEGQVWEALMYAGSAGLPNIVAIFDYNRVQLSSSMDDNVDLEPLADKLRSFRWNTLEADGHDIASLEPVLKRAKAEAANGPVAVIARTVKGKGVDFMENNYAWHGKAPNDEELARALKSLEEAADR